MTYDYFIDESGKLILLNSLYEEYSKLRKARMITNDKQTFINYVSRVADYLSRSEDIKEAVKLGHNAYTYEIYVYSDTASLI